ncbi:MAG: CHASE2 domain-containing protein [Thermosynechococcaceae cyanobacterium]
MADKLVVLRVDQGSLAQGFGLTLQIGDEGGRPSTEMPGVLPAMAPLSLAYARWLAAYETLGLPTRIKPLPNQVTNFSRFADCRQAAAQLCQAFNAWLGATEFRPVCEKILEQLLPCDLIRFILQTDDVQLQKLPWHTWTLLERYPQLESAVAAATYTSAPIEYIHPPGEVRILAILGNSAGINVEADRTFLKQLSNTDVEFLVEPRRDQLSDQLWEQHWDILFFAGHSHSQGATAGQLSLNATDTLEIKDLHYALKKAAAHGLQLAIFNSCDGLGLGRALADLEIPQLVVMREPVPDPVAQAFLKYFLQSFSQGRSLYLAMRDARERLQSLEKGYPCATWLPVIVQNPAVIPPTWHDLGARTQSLIAPLINPALSTPISVQPADPVLLSNIKQPNIKQQPWLSILASSTLIAILILGGRWLGLFQSLELWTFDRLMLLRPQEEPDPRLLIVTISEAEIQAQGEDARRSSLSDQTLSQLITTLKPYQPRAIGLDIYRDFAVQGNQPLLRQQLQEADSWVGVCKNSDAGLDPTGIAPPPELSSDQVGFSDVVADPDGALRRQLLYMTPDPASPCTTPYAFSSLLAIHYLAHQKIQPTFTAQNQLTLGQTVIPKIQSRWGGYQTIDANGIQAFLNYRARPRPDEIAPTVTLTQVLNKEVNPDNIKDKIVLIGVAASGSGDQWATPFGATGAGKVPGVFIQAHMISQLLSAVLDGRTLIWVMPPWGDGILIFCGSMVGGLFAGRLTGAKPTLIAGTATLVILTGGCFFALNQGLWIPLMPMLLAYLATTAQVVYLKSAQRQPSVQGTES